MISQIIMDFLSEFVAAMVRLIPPLPSGVLGTFDDVETGITYMTNLVRPLGIILPFDALTSVVTAWVLGLSFWASAVVLKLVLRIAGK